VRAQEDPPGEEAATTENETPTEEAAKAVEDATEEVEDGGWFDDADDNDPAHASRPANTASSLPARSTPRTGARAGARKPTPHFSVNSSVRVSVKDQITRAFSVTAFARTQYGTFAEPYNRPTSDAGGGVSSALNLGFVLWTVSLERRTSYRDLFGPGQSLNTEARTGIAKVFRLGGTWTVTPQLTGGYVWSSRPNQDRSRTEISAPIGYRIGAVEFQPVIPRMTLQIYEQNRRTGISRRDWTSFIGSGVSWDVTSYASLGAALGWEQRESNVTTADYSRWVLSPQINFKMSF